MDDSMYIVVLDSAILHTEKWLKTTNLLSVQLVKLFQVLTSIFLFY